MEGRTKEEQNELVSTLVTMLGKGEVSFTYKKTNGEVRSARGTRKMSMIPEEDYPKGKDVFCEWCTNYYDLDKMAWRRMINDNLISIGESSNED